MSEVARVVVRRTVGDSVTLDAPFVCGFFAAAFYPAFGCWVAVHMPTQAVLPPDGMADRAEAEARIAELRALPIAWQETEFAALVRQWRALHDGEGGRNQ